MLVKYWTGGIYDLVMLVQSSEGDKRVGNPRTYQNPIKEYIYDRNDGQSINLV